MGTEAPTPEAKNPVVLSLGARESINLVIREIQPDERLSVRWVDSSNEGDTFSFTLYAGDRILVGPWTRTVSSICHQQVFNIGYGYLLQPYTSSLIPGCRQTRSGWIIVRLVSLHG